MSKLAGGAFRYTDYVNDVRSGMDKRRAIFVNVSAYAVDEALGSAGITLLKSARHPVIAVAGALLTAGSITGYTADGAKYVAGLLWDNYQDKIVSSVTSAQQSSQTQQGTTLNVFSERTDISSVEVARTVAEQLPSSTGLPRIKVHTQNTQDEYIIQPGGTLWAAAKHFNTDVETLAQANGIELVHRDDGSTFALVKPGQKIYSPNSPTAPALTLVDATKAQAVANNFGYNYASEYLKDIGLPQESGGFQFIPEDELQAGLLGGAMGTWLFAGSPGLSGLGNLFGDSFADYRAMQADFTPFNYTLPSSADAGALFGPPAPAPSWYSNSTTRTVQDAISDLHLSKIPADSSQALAA